MRLYSIENRKTIGVVPIFMMHYFKWALLLVNSFLSFFQFFQCSINQPVLSSNRSKTRSLYGQVRSTVFVPDIEKAKVDLSAPGKDRDDKNV